MAHATENSNPPAGGPAGRDFYDELDRQSGRSCFTFTTLIGLLVILLIAGSAAAIWFIKKAQQLPAARDRILPSQQAKEAITKKIEALVKQSETKNVVTFELTQEELTTLLSENLRKNSFGKQFREPQLELDPPLVVIHATLVEPIRSPTRWYIELEVADQSLTARIVRVEAGKLTIPEILIGQFKTDINDLVAGFLPLAGRFEPTSVEVRRDALVISGKIK